MNEYSTIRKVIVFSVFFVALGIVAPSIIMYSLGYRFDKDNEVFVHSGSVVLKTTPASVQLSLDGQETSQKNIDFINRSLNVNGLAPKTYEVKISAPGFYPWKKQCEVHSGVATEFWNVLLVPEKIDEKTVFEGSLLKYAFSPDKKKIAYFLNRDDHVSLFVRDQDKETFVYSEPLNQRFAPSPGELKWSQDGQWLLFSLRKNNQEEILITYADTNYTEVLPLGEAWKKSLRETVGDKQNVSNKKGQTAGSEKAIIYAWDSQNNIYFILDGALYSQPAASALDWWRNTAGENKEGNKNDNAVPNPQNINSSKKNSQQQQQEKLISFNETDSPFKIKENVNGFTFCGDYLCSINVAERKLEVFDQRGDSQTSISFPESYQMTEKYRVFAYSEKQAALLDDKENLFLWDKAQDEKEGKEGLRFIFPGVQEVYFSNDGKKLLFTTKNEVYVYFTRDWEVQPKHTAGDLEIVYRDQGELQKVQWYLDYQNIFVVNKEGIKMVELDGRGGRNSADFLKDPNVSDVSYDTLEKKLWFVRKNEDGSDKLQEVVFPAAATSIFSGLLNSQNSTVDNKTE